MFPSSQVSLHEVLLKRLQPGCYRVDLAGFFPGAAVTSDLSGRNTQNKMMVDHHFPY